MCWETFDGAARRSEAQVRGGRGGRQKGKGVVVGKGVELQSALSISPMFLSFKHLFVFAIRFAFSFINLSASKETYK